MIGEFLGYVLCGLLTVMVVNGLLDKVKQKDTEITLPKQIRKKEYLMMFLFGAISFQGIRISTILLVGISVYMAFMAYTDYYTRKVYSAFSYLMFLLGIFYLFGETQNWKADITALLICIAIVMLGFMIRAYAFGDVEIYIALCPYYIKMFLDGTFLLLYSFTLFVAVFTSIRWKPLGISKTKAMAPVIAFVHFFLIVLLFLL